MSGYLGQRHPLHGTFVRLNGSGPPFPGEPILRDITEFERARERLRRLDALTIRERLEREDRVREAVRRKQEQERRTETCGRCGRSVHRWELAADGRGGRRTWCRGCETVRRRSYAENAKAAA